MAQKRRSLVAFEQWLADEVAEVEAELAGLYQEREEVSRKVSEQDVKLKTLRAVQARLAQVPDNQTEDATELVAVAQED